ncbi:CHASE2 domain-containing protein [[Limnothrix rosea] IAM M-220]|uniref:CHASE2 domain-containing protein n=1 Tax=[Limnothrix rosea] IAM M-220 TaxID=454133 RepID=UPI00095D5200|nr:CHASE2 domain-containing protein [[Limnothrix rosea] IAM M-220]OKH18880.1 hypothetical protein NIES208_03970 [[Limnothrix rosea] IAM M-220]
MKESDSSLEVRRIKFELNIEERDDSVSISVRSYDKTAHYPSISESTRLDYPEELMIAFEEWHIAYRAYYKHTAGNQNIILPQGDNSENVEKSTSLKRGRRSRGRNSKEQKFANLVESENNLIQTFSQWIESRKTLVIRDFIRQKIGVAVADSAVRSDDVLFDRVDIFIECRGEHSKEFRKLPWSQWLILPEDISKENPKLIGFFHTENNLSSDSILAPIQEKKPRFLVLVGEYHDLDFEEEIKLFKQLENKGLADVFFLNANDVEFSRKEEFLSKLNNLLQDDRGWTALALICHGDDERKIGEIIISRRISCTTSDFAASLIIAKKNGLQFAFLGCCRGVFIARDLIQHGLHQVFFLTEKVSDRLTKQFTKQFIDGLLAYQSVESIKRQITDYFLEKNQQNSFPSAHLLPQVFYHPDPEAQDFYLRKIPSSMAIWRFVKKLQPSKKESFAWIGLLMLSLSWPLQDLSKDLRLFFQSRVKAPFLQEKLLDPSIQIISIDENSILQERSQNSNFEVQPIDREYIARIIDQLSEFNAKTVGIAYLLDINPNEILSSSIENYILTNQPLLLFASQNNQNYRASTQFANPNFTFSGDISYIPWEISKPETINCLEACPFALKAAQLYTLTSQLQDENKIFLNNLMLKSAREHNVAELSTDELGISEFKLTITNKIKSSDFSSRIAGQFDIIKSQPNEIGFNKIFATSKDLFHALQRELFPISLIDYTVPPQYVYEKISAADLLASDTSNATLKQKLQNRFVILAPGSYEEANEENYTLPLAKEYWCSLGRRLGSSKCEDRLTVGEMQAYMIHHYLYGKNLRQASFLWTTTGGITVAKLLSIYLVSLGIDQRKIIGKKLSFGLIGLGIINYGVFFLGISIPMFLPFSVIQYYIIASSKKNINS